jgi:hypothetical protein
MRRLAVAVAIAIAAHEVLAALIPAGGIRAPEPREIVSQVRIVRLTIARRVRPKSRPRTAVAVHHQPRVRIVAIVPHSVEGRAGATSERSAPRRERSQRSASKPVWDVASSGVGTAQFAAQDGTAATGAGSGAGTPGTGAGAASGDEPCGFVTFSDPHGSRFDGSTRGFYVDIRMSVHFADGSSQSLILDYPWYYSSEASNPWSTQNLKDPNFPMRFQSPPVARAAAEPALVQYVAAHSTPEGLTLLRDCPGATQPPQ